MALAATGVFEVRNGGSDSNAGYFNPSGSSPGTDYSLQDAAQVTIDGASITATVQATTTQLLIAGVSVASAWNRNGLRITGGTATAGLYEITAVNTGTNVITLDRSAGTSTQTATGAMGGALASPGQLAALMTTALQVGYVKYHATAYTATSASTNVSGGCVSGTNGTLYVGYDTTRATTNTDANRPTFKIGSAVSTATLFGGTGIYGVGNFVLDGNSQTTSRGFNSRGVVWNCLFQNCTTTACAGNSGGTPLAYFCAATGNSSTSFSGLTTIFCEAYANTATPFSSTYSSHWCFAYGNTGGSTDGFNSCVGDHLVAYGNGRDGFLWSALGVQAVTNGIAEANGRYGANVSNGAGVVLLTNFASYNNTSGRSNATGLLVDRGAITGSGSFFTNAASNDFSLNNTAGAGALCRAAGFPATYPRGTTASYADVGAAQHQDSGGGGGVAVPTAVFGAGGVQIAC